MRGVLVRVAVVTGLLFWAPVAATDTVPVVAVFNIENDGTKFSEAMLGRLSDYLATQIAASGSFQIVPREQLREALARQKKQSYDACYATSCQIEIGNELAAQHTLAPRISRFGKRCVVTLKLFDLRTGTSVNAATAEGGCEEENVLDAVTSAVKQLTKSKPAAVLATIAPPPPPVVVPPPPPKKTTNYDDLDGRLAQAEAGNQGAADAWEKVERFARSSASLSERLSVLQRFIADFPDARPYRRDAESLHAELKTGIRMVRVPAGKFFSGCNDKVDKECESDETGKYMDLPAFRIDETETTVASFRRCVQAGACSAENAEIPYWDNKTQDSFLWVCNWNKPGREQHPMNCISWYQATAYCRWAGKRLPNEYEWEKAARGPDGRKHPWGNESVKDRRGANVADEAAGRRYSHWDRIKGYEDGYDGTAPVGSFPAGASPYGMLDAVGNVGEWCSNWYHENSTRAVRGGSWASRPVSHRPSDRGWGAPDVREVGYGIRCAQDE